MTEPSTRAAFIDQQLRLLQPFEFLVVALPTKPLAAVSLDADESGGVTTTIAPRPPQLPLPDDAIAAATVLGFSAEGAALVRPATAAAADGAFVERVLTEVFGASPDERVDIHHGSRVAEHEAEQKVVELRGRIQPLLRELVGEDPKQDEDGDYVLEANGAEVFVSPKAIPGGPVIVQVFSITNIGVRITPELGLFIARLNFGLLFGRFALDVEHDAVWFMETLLGDVAGDEELRFAIGMVASTAAHWDGQIAQLFGGYTRSTAPREDAPLAEHQPKPGSSGYL